MHKHYWKKVAIQKKGFILVEAIVAVVILITASLVVSSVIKSSLETNALSRDYLLAQNLATEGIEAIRAFKNSNKLKCPGDKAKWLQIGVPSNCSGGTPMSNNTDYVVFFDDDSLDGILGYQIATSTNLENLNLAGLTKDPPAVTEADQNQFQVMIREFEGSKYYFSPRAGTSDPNWIASGFYRSVRLTNLNVDNDFADFEVKIEWKDRGKVRRIVRGFRLYNLANN